MPEDQNIEKILGEQMRELPQTLRDAITSPEIEEKLRMLTQKHHLHIDQSATLENEVTLALMGFTSLYAFSDTLVEELGLSREVANALAEDISREIFEPVHDRLRRATEGDPEDTLERASVPFEELSEEPVEEPVAPSAPAPSASPKSSEITQQSPTPSQEKLPPPPKLAVDPYRESF
jgi:hypothetical protein